MHSVTSFHTGRTETKSLLTPNELNCGELDDLVIEPQVFKTSGFFWHTASLPSWVKNNLEYLFFPVVFVILHWPKLILKNYKFANIDYGKNIEEIEKHTFFIR